MKHRLRSLFALTCAVLLPCIAQAVECPSIQYDAASYEAGDRVAELGNNPKVAVGQDGDTRYFTGEHIDLRLSDAPVSVTQIDIMADFHEDKETVFSSLRKLKTRLNQSCNSTKTTITYGWSMVVKRKIVGMSATTTTKSRTAIGLFSRKTRFAPSLIKNTSAPLKETTNLLVLQLLD